MTSYKIRPVVWPNLLRGASSGNKSDKCVDKCICIESDGHFKMNCSGAETGKHTAVPFHLWSTDFDVERPEEIQTSVWEWSHIRQTSFWRQVGHLLIHGSCVQTFTFTHARFTRFTILQIFTIQNLHLILLNTHSTPRCVFSWYS